MVKVVISKHFKFLFSLSGAWCFKPCLWVFATVLHTFLRHENMQYHYFLESLNNSCLLNSYPPLRQCFKIIASETL